MSSDWLGLAPVCIGPARSPLTPPDIDACARQPGDREADREHHPAIGQIAAQIGIVQSVQPVADGVAGVLA